MKDNKNNKKPQKISNFTHTPIKITEGDSKSIIYIKELLQVSNNIGETSSKKIRFIVND